MMNKKAQFELNLTLIGIFAIIAIIGTLMFIFWPAFRFYVIGGVFVVVALVYIIKVNTIRTPEKNNMIIFLVFLLIGVGIIVAPLLGFVSQTTLSGIPEVYYPQYGNMKCSLASSDYILYEKTGLTQPTTIKCGDNMNAYTDYCDFQISFQGTSWYDFGDNVRFQKCNNAGNCIDINGVKPLSDYFDVYSINLDTNRDGYLDFGDGDIYSIIKITPGSSWFSSTTYNVRVKGNAYYLEDTQGNNYRTTYEQGCSLSAIPTTDHPTSVQTKLNYQDSSNQVPFGRSINYVWGMTKGITSNVIQKNGKWIYIQNAGSYSPILTTSDGYQYVNWQQVIPDASIQCVPSNVYICNSDATIRVAPSQNVTGQDCSLIRGVNPNDFLKASSGQCCKFNCVNNKQVTGECQTCVTCATGTIYNAQTNTCVNPTDTGNTNVPGSDLKCNIFEYQTTTNQVTKEWYNYIGIGQPIITPIPVCKTSPSVILIIIAIVVGMIIIMVIVSYKPKKRKSRSKRK